MANCDASRARAVFAGAFVFAVLVLVLVVAAVDEPVVVPMLEERVPTTFAAALAGAAWVAARRTRNAAPNATITHNSVAPATRMRPILRPR